ncbi:forkhead box protein M1 isoform X2 [Osmerus eperlanus]|uniref:forkhead box protein M1 isoform X2 n=1 Tax=Osmerus eperlanus TaxID=29151 RepID=UPI002E111DE9
MRESPRRPLILKRRKLPFQQNNPLPSHDGPDGLKHKEPSQPSGGQCFPDGIRIMDHPTMSDTQVVVIPKTADLQGVIRALTAKGKECGSHGPNKFILLSGSLDDGPESFCQANLDGGLCTTRTSLGLLDTRTEEEAAIDSLLDTKPLTTIKPLNKDLDCSPLDDSLTNIQWLGRMSTDGLGPDSAKKPADKENQDACAQIVQQPQSRQVETESVVVKDPLSERPPYSYMAMIQFAINSKRNRRMTLKEIYTWIEDHFPFFRFVAKPGWKNSIRHNLSLHDMFIRETTQDGKVSYWTIRPEANRCLTLDQVYKPDGDSAASLSSQAMQVFDQQQKRLGPEIKKTAGASERRMKPLLPRTDSYLVPIQLPITPSLYLSSSTQLSMPAPPQKCRSLGGKRVRIAPKVTHSETPTIMFCSTLEEVKEEQVCVPLNKETPRSIQPAAARRETSSSRRKQRLVLPSIEEPVLFFPNSTFFDSGLASDASASTFQDTRDAEQDQRPDPDSPFRQYSFKTPIKSSHPASSTPSKPPVLPEPWKVTPLGKESRGVLDFSPIRTPGGPSLTPQHHDFTPFSFSSTPFKELPLFNSPRELLTSARSSSMAGGPSYSPQRLQGCSRELQVGGTPLANHSLTEGLVLDTMNDSLSKILVDISFSGLEDDDLGMGNISWSQLIPELKEPPL